MVDTFKDKIQKVLNDLFDRYRLVFWYDEGAQMQGMASSIELPGVEVLVLDNNAFTIKYRILKGLQPERGFVVYCSQKQPDDADNWLLDLQQVAAPFSADMGSLYASECGIPLELKHSVVDEHIDFFKTADNRKRLTAKISQEMSVTDIELQMLSVTCKTEPSLDRIVWTLAAESINDSFDVYDKIEKYKLSNIFWKNVCDTFGYSGSRQVKDLMIVLFNDDYQNNFEKACLKNEAHIFMRNWRDSGTFRDLYIKWAEKLEIELDVRKNVESLEYDQLVSIATYPCVDKVLAQRLQMDVLHETVSVDRMESIIDDRSGKIFFDVAEHTLKALLLAREITVAVNEKMNSLIINSAAEGFKLYCNELYEIDSLYRKFIREAEQAESKSLMNDVVSLVQGIYTNKFLDELARRWQPLVDGMNQWAIDGIIPQRMFYKWYVNPFVEKNKKIFVVISDALRYESMMELESQVKCMNRMETSMKSPMLSMLPSYTQLGMAALLPNEELSYDNDADVVFVDGISSMGTDNREKILKKTVAKSLAISAENFYKIAKPKDFFKNYDLIYIYSNVIDKAGDDKASEGTVFKATEDELANIKRMVEIIRNANGTNILVTADHGYLYQNEALDESDFTNFKASGNVIKENRRFVIGSNLTSGNAVKTWNSEAVGLRPGRQIQIAKGMNRIRKQGAGSRFVHGGSMLQEIVIPVLHINITREKDVSPVDVDLLNKKSKLTTGKTQLSFYQMEPVEEKKLPLTLRIGFYDDAGTVISDVCTKTFDCRNDEVSQREWKHEFVFVEQLFKYNGKDVFLKLDRQIPNSTQYASYKEYSFKVSILFETEF